MNIKFYINVFLACIVLCLAGCGSSTQVSSTINDSKPVEEAAITSEPSAAEEEITVAEAARAYADYIKEDNQEEFDMTFGSVVLIHLDDDEIPELAFCTGTSHPNGILFYSYDGNNVIKLGGYGSFGCACYEYRKGTMYGYYSGMGSTYDTAGIEENGKLKNRFQVVITDIESADPSAVEGGYRFAITDDEFNDTEITQEEYERIINPFLIENRDYTILANDYLIPLHEIGDIEEALIKSLDSESNYPKVPADYEDTEYFSSRITTEE
jgi:hypothetical protein